MMHAYDVYTHPLAQPVLGETLRFHVRAATKQAAFRLARDRVGFFETISGIQDLGECNPDYDPAAALYAAIFGDDYSPPEFLT